MPHTIVSPEVLREHLGDPHWVVVDCRHRLADFAFGRRAYEEGRIPGAFFADVEQDLAGAKSGTNGRHPLPDPARLADLLRSFGVGDQTQIVACDEGADMFAARLWFLCRWIGHDAVAVLDGGLSAWHALGYPLSVTLSPSRRTRGSLTMRLHPEMIVDTDEVLANLESSAMRLLDARSGDRFRGDVEPIDPVAGHVPGSHNRWFKENFDERGRLKSPERLRGELAALGDPGSVVHECGSGISSAVNALAMEHAGLAGSRIYAGSWSEWCSDPKRPIATGPA